MSLFNFLKKNSEAEEPEHPRNKAAEHNARARTRRVPPETPSSEQADLQTDPSVPESDAGRELFGGHSWDLQPEREEEPSAGTNPLWKKFQVIMDAAKKSLPEKLPRKYLVRTAAWDLSAGFSLFVNAVLLGVVLLMAVKINTLQNTLNGLLGGLYDNFVRMDKSYITATILVEDMPIPLDFSLPVVQSETYVTLTRDVVVRNAIVGILSVPTTVTLPAGTSLPVSLNMNIPVQTTVLVDLQVPINIELASANSTDPAIANLHTAFLGLQDTIGPLYCLLQPTAVDYLSRPLCNDEGAYIFRTPPSP
ncbi:MAG: hypothetical protein HY781_00810 [Chloroflexi bacterium]|nr:hypothetical protein [Chloroflexota bacterium]